MAVDEPALMEGERIEFFVAAIFRHIDSQSVEPVES
jgi:hypothetical protein